MQKSDYPIYVTQPALPPLDEFIEYLKQIWETKILTNNGPFHQQFEKELADYLGVKYLSVFTALINPIFRFIKLEPRQSELSYFGRLYNVSAE